MKRLEHMKECLIACVQSQISGNLDQVDTKELGEAIDMIKDLEEAIYYCTITKAMHEDNDEEEKHESHHIKYQPMRYNEPYMNGDMESYERRFMYNEGTVPVYMGNGNGNVKEGMSPKYRRMYMEGKEKHHDNTKAMQDLENYLHELSNDIMQMLEDSTPEEKQLMRQKITTLATKLK